MPAFADWRIWGDRPVVVIVATGPSLTLPQVRLISQAHMRGRCKVIAVNDAVFPCWFADMAFAGDARWWIERQILPGFPGLKVTLDDDGNDIPPECFTVKRAGALGYSPEPGQIMTHGNSGAMAVQIAAHLSAQPIILAGFDMRNGPHWFGEYEPTSLRRNPNKDEWANLFMDLIKALPGRIYNATPGSALADYLPPFYLEAL